MRQLLFTLCLGLVFCVESGFARVLINEIMASNAVTIQDKESSSADWLELYNSGATDVSLAGYRLSDKFNFDGAWELPDTVLPAGGHLLVFADSKEPQEARHFYLEGAGYGINDWNVTDGFWFCHVKLDGDFTLSCRIRAFEPVLDLSQVGLVVRETLGTDSRYAGIFCTEGFRGQYIFKQRDSVGKTPNAVIAPEAALDYPNGWLRLEKQGDTIRAAISEDGFYWYETARKHFAVGNGAVFAGIALFSRDSKQRSRCIVSDFRLNGRTLEKAELTARQIRLAPDEVDGRFEKYRELRADFSLKREGESVYLWNRQGSIIDSLHAVELPSDVSYARKADGAATWEYCSPATPANANRGGFAGILPGPDMSPAAGFYRDPVQVHFSGISEQDSVYYTLDGSQPTRESQLYTGEAIVISSSASLRARTFRQGYLSGQGTVGVYLIDEAGTLPVVALTVDPFHLYDDYSGLFAQVWNEREAPAHIQLWEPDRTSGFAAHAGIRVHGSGGSRYLPQRSLQVIARSRYGKSTFDYPLFPGNAKKRYKRFLLRNSSQDWERAFLRDGLASWLAEPLAVEVQAYRPCVQYINGRYNGIVNLRERADEDHIAESYDIDDDRIDMVEVRIRHNVDGITLVNGTTQGLRTVIDSLLAWPVADAAFLAYADRVLDLSNTVDYFAIEFFLANTDWLNNNILLWRSSELDGKWRWMLKDLDAGMQLTPEVGDVKTSMIGRLLQEARDNVHLKRPGVIFARLLQNTDFRNRFLNRYADLLNSRFLAEQTEVLLDSAIALLAPEIARHKARWPGSMVEVEKQYAMLRSFLQHRHDFTRAHMVENFALKDTALVELAIRPAEAGTIRLNSLLIDQSGWQGVYFQDVAINLEALPKQGYRFVGWEGVSNSLPAEISVKPAAKESITAIFAPVGSSGGIVINEIMYKSGTDRDSKDWIELYNSGEVSVSLDGWILKDDNDDHSYELPEDTELQPGAFVVVCRDINAFAEVYPDVKNVIGEFDFGYGNNPGDAVRLYDKAGLLQDSVSYRNAAPWPPEADGEGPSLELISPELDNSLAVNWKASDVPGGSPGETNSRKTDVPEIPAAVSALEVYPNPSRGAAQLRFVLEQAGRVSISVLAANGSTLMRPLRDSAIRAGEFSVDLDARSLAAGVYYIILEIESARGGHQRRSIALLLHR